MKKLNRKARLLQWTFIVLLLAAFALMLAGLRESVYFVGATAAAFIVTLYWAVIEHKRKRQEKENR